MSCVLAVLLGSYCWEDSPDMCRIQVNQLMVHHTIVLLSDILCDFGFRVEYLGRLV